MARSKISYFCGNCEDELYGSPGGMRADNRPLCEICAQNVGQTRISEVRPSKLSGGIITICIFLLTVVFFWLALFMARNR